MATPKRRMHAPGTYFISSRTWESRQLFIKAPLCEMTIETWLGYRGQGKYLLHCFVLMPDHFHAVLTPGSDISLERAAQFMKGGSSRKISAAFALRFPVWQPGFTDHRVRDSQDYRNHVQYIQQNPVKEGLVERAEDYAWSSAGGRYTVDPWPGPQGLKPLELEPALRRG